MRRLVIALALALAACAVLAAPEKVRDKAKPTNVVTAPEPTSCVLLILGLSAFSLRRPTRM